MPQLTQQSTDFKESRMLRVGADETAEHVSGSGSATIRDVARLAGVSTATVSRVLSGNRPVRQEHADRVRQVAEQLDYRPNAAARSLSLGSLRHVGVLMPQLSNPYFAEIIERVSHRAAQAGYRVLIADGGNDPDGEAAAARELLEHVDGLIALSPRMPTSDLQAVTARSGPPVVVVNRAENALTAPTVVVNNFRAMTKMCGHLFGLGHRNFAYVSGPASSWQERERWRALQAAADMGASVQRIESDGRIESVPDLLDEIVASRATAIICFNDLTAIGVINGLAPLGIRCPDDVSVTGFDDIALARYVQPPLTTVAASKATLADAAWDILVGRLGGDLGATSADVPAELVIRASSGPVGRRDR